MSGSNVLKCDNFLNMTSTGTILKHLAGSRGVIYQDRRLTVELLYETCQYILFNELKTRRTVANFVLRLLTQEQLNERKLFSIELEQIIAGNADLLPKAAPNQRIVLSGSERDLDSIR